MPKLDLSVLLANNRTWAADMAAADPGYFAQLAEQQNPHFLWIGCSDSRVPANQIVGMPPGEVFVHRNVANLVVPSDMNCLSVIQFAVELLHVEHIVLCGHYGCGGVAAALRRERNGLVDHWLFHVRAVERAHRELLKTHAPQEDQRLRLLCELNVISQALNIARLPTVQDTWAAGRRLAIHGWIYGLEDGLLHDLGVSLDGSVSYNEVAARAVAGLVSASGD